MLKLTGTIWSGLGTMILTLIGIGSAFQVGQIGLRRELLSGPNRHRFPRLERSILAASQDDEVDIGAPCAPDDDICDPNDPKTLRVQMIQRPFSILDFLWMRAIQTQVDLLST